MSATTHLTFQDPGGRWRLGCGGDPFNPHVTKNTDNVSCRSCRRSRRFQYWAEMRAARAALVQSAEEKKT